MFSIRLKELREQAGYKSQQAFADVFGVAQSTVGNWEAGKREPNYKTMLKLADHFGVSVDYLLGREDTKPPIVSDEGQADKLAKALQDVGIDVDALSDPEINRIARLAKAALEE